MILKSFLIGLGVGIGLYGLASTLAGLSRADAAWILIAATVVVGLGAYVLERRTRGYPDGASGPR
jgi:hypothetical protein